MRDVQAEQSSQKTVAILSAERPERTDLDNARQLCALQHQLRVAGLAYAHADGFYEGEREHAFVVVCPDNWPTDAFRRFILKIASDFGQATVLFLGSQSVCGVRAGRGFVHERSARRAELVGVDDGATYASGFWRQVTGGSELASLDAYTYCNGAYWHAALS